MQPCALILQGHGTNRDHDVARALQQAGARTEIVHCNSLKSGAKKLKDYQMLVLAGGFSYGDALGAGKLLAIELMHFLGDEVEAFVAAAKPVIGICNGFQILVKAGLLKLADESGTQTLTLSHNERGHFECRWVELMAPPSPSIWTQRLQKEGAVIACPVAHGEGRLVASHPQALKRLQGEHRIALVYAQADQPAAGVYPSNPNGSLGDIAGLCNSAGNVLGLMPHPENNITFSYRADRGGLSDARAGAHASGLLWRAGVDYAGAC